MDKAEMLALVALKKSGAVDVSQAVAAKNAAQAAQAAAEDAQEAAETAQAAAEAAAAVFVVDDAMDDTSENPVQNKVIAGELGDLKSHITSKDEEDADYHLGFYIDENGDLCQVDEEE